MYRTITSSFVIAILFLCIISCHQPKLSPKIVSDSIDHSPRNLNSDMDEIRKDFFYLDSNRYYYSKALDMERKEHVAQVKYLQTNLEKYVRQWNYYEDRRVFYAKECNRWSDSLTGKAK